MEPKKVQLFNQTNGSDKEYHVLLEPSEGAWVVNIRYGRRGNATRTGTKTKTPLPYEKALALYDKIVREQLSDGYTMGEGGVAYQDVPEKKFTGLLPQLLNPIDDTNISHVLESPAWCEQEKHDGERVILVITTSTVDAANRKGVARPVPMWMTSALPGIAERVVLDGEMINDRFVAFDILERGPHDLRALPYDRRLDLLAEIAKCFPDGHPIECVETAFSTADKKALRQRLRERGAEGVVYKHLHSLYEPGRPNSGGSQLKEKFTESATVEVTGAREGKRSVSIGVYEDGRLVPVGNVTIPGEQPIPAVGDIVEVRYLYAYPGGSLFQPVYKGPRTDQDREACTLAQLKYKAGTQEPESEIAAPAARRLRA